MRSKFFKSLTLALAALALLGALAVPQASAQGEYPPLVPTPLDCTDVPTPTLTLDGFDIVVTYPAIYLQCVVRLVIDVDGTVLFDGPPSATLVTRVTLSSLLPGEHTITATATTVAGVVKLASLKLSPEVVDRINALIFSAGGGTFQSPSVPIALPVPGFAVTGSNVNMPIALGAMLVGAGGIALMIARRREQGLFA